MDLRCRLGRHEALEGERWNDGLYFSRCGRCGADLIRRTSRWHAVPRGYRVVWRPRRDGEIDWTSWINGRKNPRANGISLADQLDHR